MMSSVAIGHVIGTVTLLMMFFAVGTYYQNFFNYLSLEGYNGQLTQVSSYLASDFVDLVTLAQTTPGDQFLVKEVKVPFSIGEKIYNVSLTMEPSSRVAVNIARLTASIQLSNQYSTVDLPWSSDSFVGIYSDQTISGDYLLISSNLASNAASSQTIITGEPTSMMLWCMKSGETITIGFGVMRLT